MQVSIKSEINKTMSYLGHEQQRYRPVCEMTQANVRLSWWHVARSESYI